MEIIIWTNLYCIIINKTKIFFFKVNLSWAELPGVEDIGTILLTNDAKPKIYLAPLYDQLVGGCFLGVGDTRECISLL